MEQFFMAEDILFFIMRGFGGSHFPRLPEAFSLPPNAT